MRYFLERPLHVGTRQVVVISKIKTRHGQLGGANVFQGEKAPVFFILKDGEDFEAFDILGAAVAREDIEIACPETAAAAYRTSEF